MAILDDDLAKAVTEGFRLAQGSIINQDLILSGAGDVTVTLADGSKKTGPSWSKLIAQAGAAGASAAAAKTSETNAKTSETNANSSKTAAASSASAAKTSETNAKTSETNAKTSETNAKTSETNAANSASSAAASLAAAQKLTSVPYEAAPHPDVWVPFNDSLKMEGIAPYDTLTISGQVLELATKSATFTRSTTATYFDKSGTMRIADINEPRLERAGLLLESQATNLYVNSEQWGAGSRVTTTNNSDNSPRGDKTMALVIEDTAGAEHYTQDRNIALTAGTTYCFSVFVKAHTSPRNLYLRVASGSTSQSFFDATTGAWSGNPGGADYVDRGFEDVGGGIYRVWMAFKAAASQSTVIRLQLANGVTASYTGDGKSGIYVWGAQLEDSSFPTSYIKTEASAVARTADSWSIPIENAGYKTLATLFNRTIAVELTTKFMPVNGYTEAISVQGPRYDIICRLDQDNNIHSYRTNPLRIVSKNGASGIFTYTVAGNDVSMSFIGETVSATRTTADVNTVAKFGNAVQSVARFVYYLRDLRIWHRLLTPNQINGLR